MSTIVLLLAVGKTKQPQHNLPFTLFLFSRFSGFEPSSSSQKQVTRVRRTKNKRTFLKSSKYVVAKISPNKAFKAQQGFA